MASHSVCTHHKWFVNECLYIYTVEPPNKGHFGDNINSADLSFVERLSSLRRFKMYYNYIGKQIFGTLPCVLCREVYYTVSIYLGGSTIGLIASNDILCIYMYHDLKC